MDEIKKKNLLGGYVGPSLYTNGDFTYPPHFKHVDDINKVFFIHHSEHFERNLKHLFGKPNVCLEIGVYAGGSSVWFLERLCKSEGSHLYMMDTTPLGDNPLLQNNLAPYTNYTYMEGLSADSFKTLNHNGEHKEFLDFVYIDGNHSARYVLEDAVNAFYCLKPGGIICFDDYEFNPVNEGHEPGIKYALVKEAVETFTLCYGDELEFVDKSSIQMWFIKK